MTDKEDKVKEKQIDVVEKFAEEVKTLRLELTEKRNEISKMLSEKDDLEKKFAEHVVSVQVQLAKAIVDKKLKLGLVKKPEVEAEVLKLSAFSADVLHEIEANFPVETKHAKLSGNDDVQEKLSEEQQIRIKLFGHM